MFGTDRNRIVLKEECDPDNIIEFKNLESLELINFVFDEKPWQDFLENVEHSLEKLHLNTYLDGMNVLPIALPHLKRFILGDKIFTSDTSVDEDDSDTTIDNSEIFFYKRLIKKLYRSPQLRDLKLLNIEEIWTMLLSHVSVN